MTTDPVPPSDYDVPLPEQSGFVGRLIRLSLTNKLVVGVLLVLVVVLGLMAAPFDWDLPFDQDRVPVDAIPDLGENQQVVTVEWPGHSPQDVDDQITLPLTTALLNLKDVRTVRSSSMYGLSSIYVIFNENAAFYDSRSRILERLNALPPGTLPEGVQPALGPDATALGQVFWYTLEGRGPDGRPTGGWGLEELRTIQDYYVRYALSGAEGVAEVASIGGFVREFQVDLDREALRAFDLGLEDIYRAIRAANLDVSARTLEINGVEYFVRGIGFLRTTQDLENLVVKATETAPVLLSQVATVNLGPARRRGALDRNGVEAVGGVVVARFGANPMEVIDNVKRQIEALAPSLNRKPLIDLEKISPDQLRAYGAAHGFEAFDGPTLNLDAWLDHLTKTSRDEWPAWATVSQVTVVPFYDRTQLIDETLGTLEEALSQQVLITIVVVVLMVVHLRSSLLIGSMLPLAVLMTFIAMKLFGVDANIVALAGIAIAIGTIVDMGIVLCENILRHLDEAPPGMSRLEIVHRASSEVGSAVLTAVATTVVGFLPVFFLIGQAGKLFRPLAYTKTFALIASIVIALLVLPPAALLILRRPRRRARRLRLRRIVTWALNLTIAGLVIVILTADWMPLGPQLALWKNLLFSAGLILVLMAGFWLFRAGYPWILGWCLRHKLLFLLIPTALMIFALSVWRGFAWVSSPVEKAVATVGLDDEWRGTRLYREAVIELPGLGREFMPALDEGSFLWMPTIGVHGSIGEALDTLSRQDRAIQAIPEVESVVGKIGRADSALDPAPISMIETVITYKPEYSIDAEGNRVRNWGDDVRSPDDIWDKIAAVARTLGSTGAPRLQPIQTRLVMLQTGMRAPMGVKVYGENLRQLEDAAVAIEKALRTVASIRSETVAASRVVGKPYLQVNVRSDFARRQMRLYQIRPADVLNALAGYTGGRMVTTSIDGRIRIPVMVQLQREFRDSVEAIERLPVETPRGKVPLGEIAPVEYIAGPQVILSEDTFKVAYVTFGPRAGLAELEVVREAEAALERMRAEGTLVLPDGIRYRFAGQYEEEVQTSRTLSLILPIALGIIFLILYLQFRSAVTTGIVFLGIAVAWSGGFLLIYLYNQAWFLDASVFGRSLRDVFQVNPINLSTAVWVGFLALFGIATDDGVVMSTYLEQRFRGRRLDSRDAIRANVIEAGNRRVRACLMTTATTILALLPVLTSAGRGSDIMLPMALPSFGGMIIEIMTMLTVPVLYCLVKETSASWRRRRGKTA